MKELDNLMVSQVEEDEKSDSLSPLSFFLIPDRHLKYLVPDYEQHKCKELFAATVCHESYFGLARLSAYEGKFNRSLDYLNKALVLRKDPLYENWRAVVNVKTTKKIEGEVVVPLNFFKRLMCCSSVRRKATILEELECLPESIEVLWALMELSLKGLVEMEPPQYYANKIKEIDEYYGYLAWAVIYFRRNGTDDAVLLLQELIRRHGAKPEAYAILWRHYYYTSKDYNLAEDLISESLLKVNNQVFFQYYILFCIYTAKGYFKQNKFKECLQFLKHKFLEHPTYPVFLYELGHLSTKSEDFRHNGTAISALQECVHLCDSSRYGSIYYWLTKAFMLARLHIDAYHYGKLAITNLDIKNTRKINELKMCVKDFQPNIAKIEAIEKILSGDVNSEMFQRGKGLCKELKEFNRLTYDILYAKLLWKTGKSEQALKKLYSVSGISTVKMTGYFALIDYLKQQKNVKCMLTVAYEMILKCRNPQVPSKVWVKVNLIYAKILVEAKKPGKAILVLKSLAKTLPPFPFVDIPYTKLLQRAKTIQDLTVAHSKIIDSYNAYSYGTYKNSFIDSESNPREFSKKLVDESDAPGPSMSPNNKFNKRRNNRLATEKFDGNGFYQKKSAFMEDSKQDDAKKNAMLMDISQRESPDMVEFTVCSDPIFLYKIAKVAMRYNICIQDGLCAIKDYLELLNNGRDKNKQEDRKNKALKLFTMLLEQSKH